MIGITFLLSFSGTGLLVIPVLQNMPLGEAIFTIITRYFVSILAILCLNVAVIGYFMRDLSKLERYIVGVCSVILFFPSPETDVIGCVVVVVFLVKNWIQKRRESVARLPAN
jgi:TRAP-type uncharacterized transport system fused permease subunit